MKYLIPLFLLAAACGDNATPNETLDPVVGSTNNALECVPNLDGVLEREEMKVTVGVEARYRYNTNVDVDLEGLRDNEGVRVWDWTNTDPGDKELTIAATRVADKWYAAQFPTGEFNTPLDAAGNDVAIYRTDSSGLWLLGLASAKENATGGQTLIKYQEPVLVNPFPLKKGDTWVSVGVVRNSTFKGLPYAGRDTYTGTVEDEGELWLPDVEFENSLKVVTKVTSEPSVGQSSTRVQVSWLFECFGEVARAVSADGVTEADFTNAAEVRRLGF